RVEHPSNRTDKTSTIATPVTEPTNLSELFVGRVQATPDAPAYRQFDGRRWVSWTWAEAGREAARFQAGLRSDGLKPGDRIAMCLRNRVEWVLIDQAAIGLGLVTVPLYFDDRPDNMAWCLNDAGVRFLLLEDAAQSDRLKDQVHTVERVVCLEGNIPDDPRARRLLDWAPTGEYALARSHVGPSELATIVYTSGTTGRPKGVMLSHGNIVSNVLASSKVVTFTPSDSSVSFLPMSHMFERTCGYYLNIYTGACRAYSSVYGTRCSRRCRREARSADYSSAPWMSGGGASSTKRRSRTGSSGRCSTRSSRKKSAAAWAVVYARYRSAAPLSRRSSRAFLSVSAFRYCKVTD